MPRFRPCRARLLASYSEQELFFPEIHCVDLKSGSSCASAAAKVESRHPVRARHRWHPSRQLSDDLDVSHCNGDIIQPSRQDRSVNAATDIVSTFVITVVATIVSADRGRLFAIAAELRTTAE